MAEQNRPNEPNDASRKSKAEGDRDAAGITNRPLDEEIANQASLPQRGQSKPGAHAGHGDNDTSDQRSD